MYLSRGQRVKLSDLCKSLNFTITVSAENNTNASYDISCFGLDENDKCSDDKYMIFYNQQNSPCNSINLLDSSEVNSQSFNINISKLPPKIKKLVFTMTIDGEGTMSQLKTGSLLLFENGNLKGGYQFIGSDFQLEKSIMVGEIYFKNEWRFSGIGHGFNGGLSALLKHFGIVEEINDSLASPIEQPDLNNINSNQNLQTAESGKFSSFIKSILNAPLKYTEKIINERNEINQRKAQELNTHNTKRAKEEMFRQLLITYLSDGILTKQEMSGLEIFCTQNNLNLQESLNQSNNEIERFLHVMLANIVSDNIITKEEEEAINSVCYFLNPSANIKKEIQETIKRVKFIENIKSGNIQPLTNHSLVTKISELVWHCEPNVNLNRQLKKEIKTHSGEVFVTSERILFKSYDYPVEVMLKNIIEVEVDGANFFVVGNSSKSTHQFRLYEGERLGAYVEQALNKYHRKLNLNQTAKKTRSIPQDVKQSVWIRDSGQCIECQATEYLEFDHIIPFSKGGSNSTNNIQLLCRKCNLNKRDNI